MRLDKYLKVSRLIKRRTVAQSACEGGFVSVNEKTQKSAYQVKIGDVIMISLGSRPMKVRVLQTEDTVKKANAPDLYEVMENS